MLTADGAAVERHSTGGGGGTIPPGSRQDDARDLPELAHQVQAVTWGEQPNLEPSQVAAAFADVVRRARAFAVVYSSALPSDDAWPSTAQLGALSTDLRRRYKAPLQTVIVDVGRLLPCTAFLPCACAVSCLVPFPSRTRTGIQGRPDRGSRRSGRRQPANDSLLHGSVSLLCQAVRAIQQPSRDQDGRQASNSPHQACFRAWRRETRSLACHGASACEDCALRRGRSLHCQFSSCWYRLLRQHPPAVVAAAQLHAQVLTGAKHAEGACRVCSCLPHRLEGMSVVSPSCPARSAGH